MGSKAVLIIVFTSLFLGLLAMLVCLSLYAYDEDDHKNKNKAHREPTTVVSDLRKNSARHEDSAWTSLVNSSCPFCTSKTQRDLMCEPNRFVAVIAIDAIADSNELDLQLFTVRTQWRFKDIPYLVESLSSNVIAVRTSKAPDDVCDVVLEKGREYLITGTIDKDEQLAVISSCDLLVDWSAMSFVRRHSYVGWFSSKFCEH